MAEARGEEDHASAPPPAPKRKSDPDCAEPVDADRQPKHPKPDPHQPPAAENGEDADVAAKRADKGKGKMIVEEEEGDDGDDSDDSSDGGVIGGREEDESDFDDDPLAEVDLDNILPSRTRRRPPPPPGSYLVVDQDGEEDETDFEDDPQAEVDLNNILPSRTRRRPPLLPGAYLASDEDDEDEDDSE